MKRNREAFTLVELLAVILIIAILAVLILSLGEFAKKTAKNKRAHAEIEKINNTIVDYKIQMGKPPTTLSNIVALLPAGLTYTNGLPRDPWGNPYRYSAQGETYNLYSDGPTTNVADDISTAKY